MKKLSCLIVDDDIDFANLIATSIQSWGHDTVVCHNWLTVMVKIKKHPIDLIIADVETPTGNGLSVMEFLSIDPLVSDLKKVFVTGLNDDYTRQRCRDMGADYIHKSNDLMVRLKDYCQQQAESMEPAVTVV